MEICIKVYLLDGTEHFVIEETNAGEKSIMKNEEAFPDNLLSLLYLDMESWDRRFAKAEEKLRNGGTAKIAIDLLNDLMLEHIYFALPRFRWDETCDGDAAADALARMWDELAQTREQSLQIFREVLSDTNGKEGAGKRLRQLHDSGAEHFAFGPLTVRFEPVWSDDFAEVLYPDSLHDLVDFSLRQCVQRGLRMRVCKNCGRYFAVTGHGGTEYCDRVFDSKGRTCKEVGAMRQYAITHAGDEVWKDYRREYKKRFARMRAGKLSSEDFYAWSKEAQEKKAAYDSGALVREAFLDWLAQSVSRELNKEDRH